MYRQGDVLLVPIENRPWPAKKLNHCVVAHGEVTGHTHRFEQGAEQLEHDSGDRYIVVQAARAELVHEEHGTLVIPQGVYRVVHQREYTPGAARPVIIPDEPELAAPVWARPAVRKLLKVAARVKELADSYTGEARAERELEARLNRDRAALGRAPVRVRDGVVRELNADGNYRRVRD